MNLTLIRVGLSNIKRHPWQTLFLILGVTLGVAVIVAIDIANESAKRSFTLSLESISGRATHKIVGGEGGIDEKIYVALKTKTSLSKLAPIITGHVNLLTNGKRRPLKILGVDIFAEAPFRKYLKQESSLLSATAFKQFMLEKNSVIISQELAQKYDIKKDAIIHLLIQSRTVPVKVIAIITPQDSVTQKAASGIILTDISTAQDIFQNFGKISYIDVLIDKNIKENVDIIQNLLPPEVRIEETEQQNQRTQRIISSFQLNLTALSLLAILIGGFIIYDTVTFSVVRRRQILGILRSIGATKQNIFFMIMGETLVMAMIGMIFGVVLGLVLGQLAVRMVTQTMNDLYFTLTVTEFSFSYFTLLKGAIGILVALIAALMPAIEATQIDPVGVMRRSLLESKVRKLLPKLFIAGIIIIIVATGILFVPSKRLDVGFGAIFILILGTSVLLPSFVYYFMNLMSYFANSTKNVVFKMAPRNINRSLSRTTIAIAALTVSISSLIAISIMIGSFRTTFLDWIGSVLTADIFVSAPNQGISRAESFPLKVLEQFENIDGIKSIHTSRSTQVEAKDYGKIRINAVSRDISRGRMFLWHEGDTSQIWAKIEQGSVIVSEPFAYSNNITLKAGNKVSLYSDKGLREFPIVGIFYDYSSSQGQVMMADGIYRNLWDDDQITSIAFFLEEGQSNAAVVSSLGEKISDEYNLIVRSNKDLLNISLQIFDRTFTITTAMQILVGLVAFIGIVSTLMALQLERRREVGVLRANGMTPKQLVHLIFYETGLMGLTAGIVSIPLGFILSIALIYVINLRSFGWTIQLFPNPQYFFQAMLIAIFAATLAGIYPAIKFAKTNIVSVLREE